MQLRIIPFFLLLSHFSFGQFDGTFNISLVSQTNERFIDGRSYNDVWGFEAADGREYAILGGKEGTIILDLVNSAQPTEVAFIPGASSIWRDMKSFGNYVYVVADRGQDGLLIINMENAPATITWEFWKPTLTAGLSTATLQKCHNLYIDENGICFLAGCNLNGGGVLMFDLATTPGQPEYLGPATFRYSHDVFARGDTLYSADLSNGFFSVTDVSNKQNPEFLAAQETTRDFTHNVWLSDDGNYLFTTDERSNAFVDAYDISDLGNIQLLDTYRPLETEGSGVLPHNVHYYNGYLVISYYADGVKIVDASRPWNLIEVAAYDTSPNSGAGNGCWGAFPYLNSGLVLASDMEEGLFVLEVDYKRGSYLEGSIRDQQTGIALSEVAVTIKATQKNFDKTGPDGRFHTGTIEQGTFTVRFTKEGYYPKEVEVSLQNGLLTELNIELEPIQKISFAGLILNEETNSGIPAKLMVQGENGTFSILANSFGAFSLEDVPEGIYDIYVGSWGFRPKRIINLDLTTSQSLNVALQPGYVDDFSIDQGWEVKGTANSGQWVREIPIGTNYEGDFSNPAVDAADDDLGFCYITGNGEGDVGAFDVDDGSVKLISPPMDLQSYENPSLSFYYWFYNAAGVGDLDDTLNVFISNGQEKVLLTQVTENTNTWTKVEFNLQDYIELTDNMVFMVETGDLGNPHLVEAGIDGFLVQERIAVANENIPDQEVQMTVFPNPFTERIQVQVSLPQKAQQSSLRIYNQLGKEVEQLYLSDVEFTAEIGSNWNAGIYFLVFEGYPSGRIVKKLVKQ